MKIRNTFIIFIVSGFWHGANWTFIVWGALNALFFLPLLLSNKNRQNIEVVAKGRYLPSLKEAFMMLATFGLTVLAWIFFRAENLRHALSYIRKIFSPSLFHLPYYRGISEAGTTIILILLFVLIEWMGREGQYAIADLGLKWKKPVRYAMYYFIVFLIIVFGNLSQNQFIYFQF